MNIDQEIDRKKLAMSGMPPDQVQRRLRGAGGLLDALAAQKLLSEKEAYKRDFAMQMEQRPQTIAEKNEERLKQLSQTDVAEGVAGVLQNRKKRQDANTKMLAGMDPRRLKAMTKRPMGIPNAPVPRVQKAAQGGIVGFQAGMTVPNIDTTNDPAFLRKPKGFAAGVPYSPYTGANISLMPTMPDSRADTVADVQDEFIAEVGTQAFEYLKNNPAEAAAIGVTAIPGVGLAFKLGKAAGNIGKMLISGGARALKSKTALGIGSAALGTGAFLGQDVLNPALQNPAETMKSVGETAVDVGKGIAALPKKAYTGARELMGIESPGLFSPDGTPASTTPQVDTTPPDAAPATMTELGKPSDIARLIDQSERTDTEVKPPKSKEEVPKVTGDESPEELNKKERVINRGLDELAIRLQKFARSDPRKPGGYAAASYERDMEILAENKKVHAMRLKERELEIRADLNNLRREELTQNFFIRRMASLDKSMLDALEIGRDSPLYLDAVTALQAANKELKDLMDAEDNIFFKPEDTTIQAARNKVMLAEGVLKAMEDKYTGSFTAEKEALSKKYTEMYGTEYTGGETKEDFNLKDQRTVGQ